MLRLDPFSTHSSIDHPVCKLAGSDRRWKNLGGGHILIHWIRVRTRNPVTRDMQYIVFLENMGSVPGIPHGSLSKFFSNYCFFIRIYLLSSLQSPTA